jgi:hypothetical protein
MVSLMFLEIFRIQSAQIPADTAETSPNPQNPGDYLLEG